MIIYNNKKSLLSVISSFFFNIKDDTVDILILRILCYIIETIHSIIKTFNQNLYNEMYIKLYTDKHNYLITSLKLLCNIENNI